MNFLNNLAANVLSIFILLIIIGYTKKYSDTETVKNRIFSLIVIATIMMLVFDIFGRMDGYPDTFLPVLNHTGNFLLFFFSPLISSLWLLYVRQFISLTKRVDKWLLSTIISVNAVNWISVILSLRFNWYYYIDENNIYHRGPLNSMSFIFAFLLIAVASLLVIINREKIERKYYSAFLLFMILPIICIMLQIFIYGFTFTYNGVALSVFILFLFVQVQDIFTDYLTGVANRKKLELHLRKKALDSTPGETFSAIMLDLDNFKKINDTLGHRAGDSMLRSAALLLKECLGDTGLIARYGGDEFCIVLDTSDPVKLKEVVANIRGCIKEFNAKSDLPVDLGMSMGYAIYRYGTPVDDFQNTIDKLMYEHKRYPQTDI